MAKADITGRLNLDSTGFERGIQRSRQSVKGFAKSSMATFVRMGTAFAGIGLVKSIVGLGTAAAETASKFNAVFGSAAGAMNEKVQELRDTIPSTTEEMQGALATFAQMAKAFGLNSESANLFSVEMVKIAGDIASFNNLPIEEAFTKIRSAISGEFEPMKSLGIVINEARLKQEALNLAIWDGTGQMSAAQKALAVQAILIKDMGDANGDAALTANSAANQIKFLQKSLKETGTEIGTTILPGVVALTGAFSKLLSMTKGAMEGVGTSLGELVYGNQDRVQAEMDLAAEGITRGKGRGGAVKYEKAIENQIEKNKEAAEAAKIAAEQKRKADEEAIKNAGDLKSELESQIKTEADPVRNQASKDRLKAHQDLLDAAGDLKTIETLKPKQIQDEKDKFALAEKQLALIKAQAAEDDALTHEAQKQLDLEKSIQDIMKSANVDREEAVRLAKELAAASAGADTNQSGYTTPREQRAAERKQRKEDQARRRREREERAAEVGAAERGRQKQREQLMTEREQAAGLTGTTAGRNLGGTSANDKAAAENAKGTDAELKEQTKILTTIKEEIQKNP